MTNDNDSDRTIRGTPFYPRTALLNQWQKWNAWDQYHIVDSYTDWRAEVATIREQAAALDQTPLSKHYVAGPDAERFVDYIIPRDTSKIQVGQIYFTPWCNEEGVQVGDGLVARLEPDKFLFSADPMMRWFERNAGRYDVKFSDVTHDFGLLSLQGPRSTAVLEAATGENWRELRFSRLRHTTIGGVRVLASRQGFTGERGYELWVASEDAVTMWDALFEAGTPLGLGVAGLHAVDVARVEAGLVLPGSDYTPAAIDPGGDQIPTSPENRTTPLELNMHRFIDFDKEHDFLGKASLRRELETGPRRKMVGIVMNWHEIVTMYQEADVPPEITPRVIRTPLPILLDGARIGRVTSATWSPTIGEVIGFAHVTPSLASAGTPVVVDWDLGHIRGEIGARLVDLPHYQLRRTGGT